MKSAIVAWENEKKMRAKIKSEKIKVLFLLNHFWLYY